MDLRLLAGLGITLMAATPDAGAAPAKRTCLVLADGYVSEYAWGRYQEMTFPWDHPGHDYCVRGLLENDTRFQRWLKGWNVRRVDLEQLNGPLRLDGVDLVILDDVRQCVCDPHEATLVEFVRAGGGLLVYAGFWGLGGCPKSDYCMLPTISSYQHTPLGALLPVAITRTPDLESLREKPAAVRRPLFTDAALGRGLDAPNWEVFGLHDCQPRGEVLATVDGRPLIARGAAGQGRVVVYTGDDLAWLRAGVASNRNPYAGTLWRRLAALAVGDPAAIAAAPDPVPTITRRPALAHPDQPLNFLWGGAFYYRTPEMEHLWARDLAAHSVTLYGHGDLPESVAKASGAAGWGSFGCPLNSKTAVADAECWMVDAAGKPVEGRPCYTNPQSLRYLEEAVRAQAAALAASPWVTYGHMGDESEFGNCYCEHCRAAFRAEFGYELPPLRDDFSPQYLDQWIDYHRFKNGAIGRMYARATRVAHQANPRLRMFASLPLVGGTCHGDDLYHTQAGFDLLWDHTYPGTMAIRVGLHAALLEETAMLQGRPEVPILDLLQGFDSYDRVSHMPPPEYVREMAWQAIAHGIDSIGWFVYNYCFWNMPGSEAWAEAGRLAEEVLEPLTPTLYQMRNAQQPVGLLYCYSQEAVDGLKEATWDEARPWKGLIRWWTTHATQEAYAVLKYAGVPLNVVSEHRLLEGQPLPWKVLVIPYVEHLHARSRRALEAFLAAGGKVYVGANSTLELPGVQKLPVSFDTKFTTWWPVERKEEWNQRRARQYVIGPLLEKARQLRPLFAAYRDEALVTADDPEVVTSVREAGVARYLFAINDHQVNPTSPEMRARRQQYNHFMLLPMTFPRARATLTVRGEGILYPLLPSGGRPRILTADKPTSLRLDLEGGGGRLFLLLPEPVQQVVFTAPPVRVAEGVRLSARVLGRSGVLNASLPLRIDLRCGRARQSVYATTREGTLTWTAPFLNPFPAGPVSVTLTELASGVQATGVTE